MTRDGGPQMVCCSVMARDGDLDTFIFYEHVEILNKCDLILMIIFNTCS